MARAEDSRGLGALVLEEESVRDDDASVATMTLDVDVEEVQDRLDLLKDTVDQLGKEHPNVELLKIAISTYTIEKAKILRLIYRFKTVRYIRESPALMADLARQENELKQLDKRAELLILQSDQKDLYK